MAPGEVMADGKGIEPARARRRGFSYRRRNGVSCRWETMRRIPSISSVNADEMEPGTFKDRLLLEGDPHQLIEGMIVSAYAIQADVGYIFLRWAYKLAAERLEQAIAEAYR